MKTLLRLLIFLKPLWGQVVLSILLGTATIASGIGLLGTSASLIARAALQPSIATLQVAIVGVRFFGISRGLLRYLERLVSHSVNFRLLTGLRGWFFRVIEPLAPARLGLEASGDLLSRAVGDIDTLENFYIRVVSPPWTALLVTIGVGLFVGSIDLNAGLVLGAGMLFGGMVVPVLGYTLGKSPGAALVNARAKLSAVVAESVLGIGEITAYNRSVSQMNELLNITNSLGKAQLRQVRSGALINVINQVLVQVTLMAVLVAAIPQVNSGLLPGYLLAVLAMVTIASFEAVMPLPLAAQRLEESLAAGRRLLAFENVKPAIQEPNQPVPQGQSGNQLEICKLSFGYSPAGQKALDNVSMTITRGERVALVGPSGAGKSTLVNLLARFWKADEGSILIDGRDILDFSSDAWHANIALLSQSPYLFSASVRENLRLASPAADDGMLKNSLCRAGLENWLATLERGLDTWIGEHGLQLSSGERKRLACARIILQGAPFVVLDEPAAQLDAITERDLIDSLIELFSDRGVLLITHRLVRMERMDEIIVLDRGQIQERGKHAELIQGGGMYHRLWQLQHRLLEDLPEVQEAC